MNWNSVFDILKKLENQNVQYAFLRNAEAVGDKFDEGEDWDILCENKAEFVKTIGAEPLLNIVPCYNYYTFILSKKLFLDIREIGDGYYDRKWEMNMLYSRVKYNKKYTLSEENYKYSILYHCIIQKKDFGGLKYKNELYALHGEKENYISILADYMKNHKYSLTFPDDVGVYVNRKNCKLLEKYFNG